MPLCTFDDEMISISLVQNQLSPLCRRGDLCVCVPVGGVGDFNDGNWDLGPVSHFQVVELLDLLSSCLCSDGLVSTAILFLNFLCAFSQMHSFF